MAMSRGKPEFHPYDYDAYALEEPGHKPGRHLASRHSEDEDEDEPPELLLGMLPAIPAGYLLCTLVAAEGVFILLDMRNPFGGAMTSVGKHNPWYHMQWLLLEILGWGDLTAAAVGAVGLWLAAHPLPDILNKFLRWDAVLSLTGVGSLVAWRFAVVLAVVPWVGFVLAFEPTGYARWPRVIGAAIYLAFNSYMMVLLLAVLRAASEANQRLKEERQDLLQRGLHEEERGKKASMIFGCLPLEGCVGIYMLLVMIGSIIQMIKIVSLGTTGGGWIFFSNFASLRSETYWMEVFTYFHSIFTAFLSGCAVVVMRGMDTVPDEGSLVLAKRCTVLVLSFFLATLFRFALYVPITGMALAAGDICGVYVRLMASLSLEGKLLQASALHCTVNDCVVLVLMIALVCLDGYLATSVLQLWQRYRDHKRSIKRDKDYAGPPIARASVRASTADPLIFQAAAQAQ